MMQTFMNNWEGLEYDIKTKTQHVEQRCTLKEYVKPPERVETNEEYFAKMRAKGFLS
jgi:hypothetical protein